MSIRPIMLWLPVVVSLLAVTDARASWWHVGGRSSGFGWSDGYHSRTGRPSRECGVKAAEGVGCPTCHPTRGLLGGKTLAHRHTQQVSRIAHRSCIPPFSPDWPWRSSATSGLLICPAAECDLGFYCVTAIGFPNPTGARQRAISPRLFAALAWLIA
jgi:hypothetical protein